MNTASRRPVVFADDGSSHEMVAPSHPLSRYAAALGRRLGVQDLRVAILRHAVPYAELDAACSRAADATRLVPIVGLSAGLLAQSSAREIGLALTHQITLLASDRQLLTNLCDGTRTACYRRWRSVIAADAAAVRQFGAAATEYMLRKLDVEHRCDPWRRQLGFAPLGHPQPGAPPHRLRLLLLRTRRTFAWNRARDQ